jgi:hypothetical protein
MTKIIQFPHKQEIQKDPVNETAPLKITFYECHPREDYLRSLRNAIQHIEEGGLTGFEADPDE